ncbi:MAG: amidase [candidate division NC10 bacterium]|nr:amidase [candidate division NC10 bacterium]
MMEPYKLTLSEAADLIRAKRLSPVELIRSCLDRIEKVEPKVLAWARITPEETLAEAERLERLLQAGTSLGPLHGIPIGVKDIFYTAGLATEAGTKILKGFVPSFDATVVKRLREAGAILLGKTTTTEFAYFDPAATRNPWNLDHTPGGSSSGSAAAVSAEMCLGAFGSQTAGSIIRPAAYCGVVGLKPTYGRVSRYGILPFAWTLDHPGPFAKTVRDIAILLEGIAGPDPLDASTTFAPRLTLLASLDAPPSGLIVGVPDRYFPERSDPSVASAFKEVLKVLEGLGMRIREVTLPESFEAGVEAGRLIMHVEGAAAHLDRFKARGAEYSPKLKALIEAGMLVPGVSYLRAQQVRAVAIQAMRGLFQEIDLLATPATPTPAPEGLRSTGDPVFNLPFTTFGLPALTVPMGFSPAGLPVGLQLIGRPFEEALVFRAGQVYESATEWHTRRPPL